MRHLAGKFNRQITDEMYAMYQSGATMGEVAERHGVTVQAVSARFAKAGLATRAPGHPKPKVDIAR